MKSTMLKSLSLLGIYMIMTSSLIAQTDVKVKTTDKETKYKTRDVKVKVEKEEAKYKEDDLKIKEGRSETKIKGKVKPMQASTTERTEIRTGETEVRAKEHIAPLTEESVTPTPAPVVLEPVAIPKNVTKIKQTTRKSAASKSTSGKRTAARKTTPAPKYVVRTKVVRDTVFVASPPERIVSTQTEYLHDTVFVNRVDTVVKTETSNTYTGYQVPSGDFKKVKLKKDKDGEVWMKRKEKDGIKTEKLKQE